VVGQQGLGGDEAGDAGADDDDVDDALCFFVLFVVSGGNAA
jgi:hypothetical protein